jgi:sugar phosphate permease
MAASITSRAIAADTIRLADHTRHQTALRLLPFLFVLYITNYLDRTSLAYAAIGMKRDLGFSDVSLASASELSSSAMSPCKFLERCWWSAEARAG